MIDLKIYLFSLHPVNFSGLMINYLHYCLWYRIDNEVLATIFEWITTFDNIQYFKEKNKFMMIIENKGTY